MALKIGIVVLSLGFAIALFVSPSLMPGARGSRVPVAVGLVLLALVNLVRIGRERQIRGREARLAKVPKKPLGL